MIIYNGYFLYINKNGFSYLVEYDDDSLTNNIFKCFVITGFYKYKHAKTGTLEKLPSKPIIKLYGLKYYHAIENNDIIKKIKLLNKKEKKMLYQNDDLWYNIKRDFMSYARKNNFNI
jgi:hypothetical protein